MTNNSRVKNTILNFTSSIIGQFIVIIMQFIVRTVFINTLGKSFLGINGLFSNILSMLSLAEMGVGNAIIFKLYDPLAKNDKSRINALMNFYKIVYRCIGIVIAIIGICLIPFLPSLINDYETLEGLNVNAPFIFALYLFDSVASYLFFAYKSAIIKADQREYNINLISYIFTIASGIAQIIAMIIFRSFEIYVVITVIKTIGQNIVIAHFVDHKYPFLRGEMQQKIDVNEAKAIFKDCGALFLYKVNNVVVKSTDNIILSIFMGLDSVALYSNYYIFYTTISGIFVKVFNSVGHSIGNLHTVGNSKQEYKVFETVMLIASILGGTAFVEIFVIGDEVIQLWIGDSWVIVQPFAFLLGLEIYTASIKQALAKYRTAYGLFRQGWARPLVGMITNLIISIVLVRLYGIIGVLIGTIISDWITCMWFDPLILHNIGFKKKFSVLMYFKKLIKYFITVCVVSIVNYCICSKIAVGYGWISVIIHALFCGITTPLVLLLASYNSQEMRYVLEIVGKGIKKLNEIKTNK